MKWFIDVARVNIEDLLSPRPNAIIRCDGNPHECIFPVNECEGGDVLSFGCVFCGGVTSWRASDVPPRKCASCGAPPHNAPR